MRPDRPDRRQLDELLAQARRICELFKTQSRRPYILELAGTPKAGKTSTLGIVQAFLKDAGFRVSLMRERAADCPIAMKGHFFFNAWTSATMLAEVLAELDSDCDVLILDRGFFDALVWLELQWRRGQVTEDEKAVFERFMLLPRWQTLTDLTVLLFAEPEVAMERENLGRLLPRTGSIMNRDALLAFNAVLRSVAARFAEQFQVLSVDATTTSGPLQTASELLSQILPLMKEWVDPEILALPYVDVSVGFEERPALDSASSKAFLSRVSPVFSRRRSTLERDASVVQLVGAVAFRHRGRYVLIQRSRSDPKSDRFGTYTLWHRCHLRAQQGTALLDAATAQLSERVREDLHLSQLGALRFCGMLWSPSPEERNHLGLAFVVDIDDPETAESLATKEFRRGKRAPSWRTHFKTLEELETFEALETWSKHAARQHLLEDPRCATPTSPTS